jgi:hypothetical protein
MIVMVVPVIVVVLAVTMVVDLGIDILQPELWLEFSERRERTMRELIQSSSSKSPLLTTLHLS